jgi:hypothetical protein
MELRPRKSKRKAHGDDDSVPVATKRERIGEHLVMVRPLGETRHRNCMCGTLEVEPVPTQDEAPFFKKLPQEIRDQVYHWLWLDTPRIKQRFQRKTHFVSYGEQSLTKRETYDGKVRFMFRTFISNVDLADKTHRRRPGS